MHGSIPWRPALPGWVLRDASYRPGFLIPGTRNRGGLQTRTGFPAARWLADRFESDVPAKGSALGRQTCWRPGWLLPGASWVADPGPVGEPGHLLPALTWLSLLPRGGRSHVRWRRGRDGESARAPVDEASLDPSFWHRSPPCL